MIVHLMLHNHTYYSHTLVHPGPKTELLVVAVGHVVVLVVRFGFVAALCRVQLGA